jgi:hypothetical protein
MSVRRRFFARVLAITWAAGFVWITLVWPADRGAAYLAALESIKTEEIQQHVNYLADEKLEGREAGTRGGYAAAEYLRQRLAALKLAGAGTDGAYLQAFSPNFRNVLAKLEGADPKLRSEVIVVGAHYDHVGFGKKGNTLGEVGQVHPGADDNASGTSALLELAEALTILAEPPRRTILLAFWDAEEKGMLGSKHWVAHPTFPIDRVRLVVNMDMVGRLRNDRLLVFGTRSGYGLRRWVSGHNQSALRLEFSWNALPNADHFPFFSQNIPFITFHTDLHEQYHRPTDKAELISSAGIRRVARLVFALVHDLADADQTPAFRASARNETEEIRRGLAQQPAHFPDDGKPLRVGIIWRADDAEPSTAILTGVMPNSPAARAGLQVDDRIYQVNGRNFAGEEELLRLLGTLPSPIHLGIERNGQLRNVEVRLEAVPLRRAA